ncbi:MAG: cytochrome c [Thermoleophilia bacterium]|nr:cytochrome c [Thermoleophilia bacterium]
MPDKRLAGALVAVVAAAGLATGVSTAAKAPTPKTLVQKNCAGCHTMKAAKIHGTFGPNLDKTKPTKARVLRMLKNGGVGMPAFTWSKARRQAVADWVAKKT